MKLLFHSSSQVEFSEFLTCHQLLLVGRQRSSQRSECAAWALAKNKTPPCSLKQKVPEHCPLLRSWEERDTGAVSVSWDISVQWFGQSESGSWAERPRTESGPAPSAPSCLQAVAPPHPSAGWSLASFRFNTTGSVQQLLNTGSFVHAQFAICCPGGNWTSQAQHTSQNGSFPWSTHPLQPKVTGLHSRDSRAPKWVLHTDVILSTELSASFTWILSGLAVLAWGQARFTNPS